MQPIVIRRSTQADTRTCDPSKVTKSQLFSQSQQHIDDVQRGMAVFGQMLVEAAKSHDHTKLTGINNFHSDFVDGFKNTEWWDNHRYVERHHLSKPDGVPKDVDLIDVLEFIADSVMGGMARSGECRQEEIHPLLLKKAFDNTMAKLLERVVVTPE